MKGRCTYTASGTTLFRRDTRRFIFSTCPVLTYERCAAVLRACSSLCITGPCSSGKTLVMLHTLVDIISTRGMEESAVYLDLDLSFDLQVFRRILCHQIKAHTSCTSKLNFEVEESIKRLVYLPIYNIEDLPALLVALDAYFHSNSTRFIAVDSILTKHGKGEDNRIVSVSIQLLEWLRNKHGLAMVYTNREGAGYSVPFQVSTLYHEDAAECFNASFSGIEQVELENNILTFGLPLDWVPGNMGNAASATGEAYIQGTIKGKLKQTNSGEDNIPSKKNRVCASSTHGGMRAKDISHCPGVTLRLLPCKKGSTGASSYIGCILKGIGTDRDWYSDLSWFSERNSRSYFSRLRPLYYITSEINETGEAISERVEHNEQEYTQTQDLVMSTQSTGITAPIEAKEIQVIMDSPQLIPSSSRSTYTVVDAEILATLRFALFRINRDKALMEQIFTLHR